jgi:hypothetical protein
MTEGDRRRMPYETDETRAISPQKPGDPAEIDLADHEASAPPG